MPPKKPIKIKLKNVAPADTKGYTTECWELLVKAVTDVLVVPSQAAPADVGGADRTLQLDTSSPIVGATAITTAARVGGTIDGIRARQVTIHRLVSSTVSFHRVYTAASDLARTDAPAMLQRVTAILEEQIPAALNAWLGGAEAALRAHATSAADGDDASVAPPFDAQACMRHVVACWEFVGAAVRVVADYVAYLDNTYARLHAPVDGGICGIGTALVGRLLASTYATVFATVCRGYVDAVADDRAGNATRWSDLSSCRALLLATNAYHARVEAPLIEGADKFFTKAGNVLVYGERLSAAEWVRRVDTELRTEDRRLQAYGHTSASRAIMQMAYERLVKTHLPQVATTALRGLIQEGDHPTLTAIHRLSRHRFVKHEDAVKKAFRDYVSKAAQEILAADASVEDGIIDMLIALNHTATTTVNKCFAIGNSGTDAFSGAKKDAFETAMRGTKVGGANRAAELLAKYLDALLRDGIGALRGGAAATAADGDDAAAAGSSGLTAAEQTDAALIEAMRLFHFVPNKDVFEALYMRHFGKRLILQRSAGIEHERVVIEQLRLVCGPSSALKLNGMLKDMELSKELVALYRNTRFVRTSSSAATNTNRPGSPDAAEAGMGRQQSTAVGMMGEPSLSDIGPAQSAYAHTFVDPSASLPPAAAAAGGNGDAATAATSSTVDLRPCGFDFNVLVLTEGYWPTFTVVTPSVPVAIDRQMDLFRVFYLSKHGSRKLQWHHALSHCVLKARFPKARGAKELVVSFIQAMILSVFNDTDTISYGDLLQRLGVAQCEELTCAIIGLYAGNARVLLREKAEGLPSLPPPTKKTDARIVVRNEDVIKFNEAFTHRLVKIRVNQVQLRETKEEVTETTEKVMAERHFIVDAAIVRYMKSRKQARHNDLVAEVLGMLRFEAQPAGVKKRIEHLIEREYLERDDADPGLYRYLA